jgi:hypothetical protein
LLNKRSGKLGLSGAALFDGLDCGSRYGRESTGIGAMKADQDLVRRVLQPRVGLVQHASRLARQLAELITIGHMAECPENQIRTHYEYLLKKWLPERNYPAPPVQLATKDFPVADSSIHVL